MRAETNRGRAEKSATGQDMRVALLGGGTIARLVLEQVHAGALPGIAVVALAGRRSDSPAAALARRFDVPYLASTEELSMCSPHVVLEAASHDAIRAHLVRLLEQGIDVVVLSAGALADDALRRRAEAVAERSGARMIVPSGGIGGLDALKAAMEAGVDEVSIRIAKPPAAWRGIEYVEQLGIDLDTLKVERILFDGPAREGVPHFPQNVNIAAVLSMAGLGFDRTRLVVVADPGLTRNTHTIRVAGKTGRFSLTLENVPTPDNPKTAWLACYSALAALRGLRERHRYGT